MNDPGICQRPLQRVDYDRANFYFLKEYQQLARPGPLLADTGYASSKDLIESSSKKERGRTKTQGE
jgi:hypothetical protein